MRLLFTKSTKPLSIAIRDVTNEPVSHVALEFPEWNIIVHSNLLGLHIEWADHFKSECEIIYILEADFQDDKERLGRLLDQYELSFYDFGALFFLCGAILAKRYLKLPLPKTNLWQSSGMFLCTEWVTEYVTGEEDSLITPYKLYVKLKALSDWTDVSAA